VSILVLNRKEFRWDIQGLRALAVLSVVLYHIAPMYLPGGFIGVDIFFVISGYLIIGHIWKDLNLNTFKLTKFYSSRIKRLFPAFFTTIVISSIFAYIYLLPNEFNDYALSVYFSILYISNFWFYTKSGYFDGELDYASLLHTWSLSVEEQFYIVFPVLLLLIYRKQKQNLVPILLVILAVSLCVSEILLRYDESLSFYLSPTRFWQFIAGGLLSIFYVKRPHSKLIRELITFVALITLILCMFLMSPSNFPGLKAIIPTLATALIIYSCSTYDYSFKVLSNPIARFFGNISYSLYLWHWPVIVFYKLSINEGLQGFHKIYVLMISIFLGYISYRFIENSTRKIKSQKMIFTPVSISILLSIALCITLYIATNFHLERFTKNQIFYASYLKYSSTHFRQGECFLTSKHNDILFYNKNTCIEYDSNKYNTLLIGDSHAAHWFSALKQKQTFTTTLSQVTSSGCRPTINTVGAKRCSDLIGWAFNDLVTNTKFDKIFLSGNWQNSDVDKLKETIKYLENYSDNIVVLGPMLKYKTSLPRILALSNSNDEITQQSNYSMSLKKDGIIESAVNSTTARYISILKAICPGGICATRTKENIPIQFDSSHLTKDGATYLLEKIDL
jgi:peptidoglycan/LPS O-acetylase OafA/YrhL